LVRIYNKIDTIIDNNSPLRLEVVYRGKDIAPDFRDLSIVIKGRDVGAKKFIETVGRSDNIRGVCYQIFSTTK
jgi:hypothetical protein